MLFKKGMTRGDQSLAHNKNVIITLNFGRHTSSLCLLIFFTKLCEVREELDFLLHSLYKLVLVIFYSKNQLVYFI